MKSPEAMRRLVRDLHDDGSHYELLRELLEQQFQAALRHQTETLSDLAERIVEEVEVLDRHRRDRVLLLGRLGLKLPASMQDVFAMLDEGPRVTLTAWWQGLELLVRECKALNARNCRLLMDQNATMQRVLNQEADIYVPS
ncbi:MAG: flgN [Rhizobacter sp.]|jgi:flagella synthesis protein FlgN|nr:flgN [Rhizobacter sp.]